MAINQQEHFRALESMYSAAPINAFYKPRMLVEEGKATIEITATEAHQHSAGAVHGSVYFKMLDDAAFFAVNSFESKVFVVTTSFTTYLTRPVGSGLLRAVGQVVNSNRQQYIAEAIIYDQEDKEIGRGNGVFMRSKMLLKDAAGYLQSDS